MNLKRYRIILIGILFVVIIWILESTLHTFIFTKDSDFIENLFFPLLHEFWMRVLIVLLILILSMYVQHLVNSVKRIREIEEKLKISKNRYQKSFEQAEFYKDLFAHDISNILQNINTSQEFISLFINNPEKREYLQDLLKLIDDQIARGLKLVLNIRNGSQISETGGLLESVNLIHTLKEALEFIYRSHPDKKINIEIESKFKDPIVKANNLLLDVFENILFNAVKHNKCPKIEILIRISKWMKNGTNYIKIEFIDNGIGVSNINKERIFKGISHRREKTHGMGLGLLLVKTIIENYNGQIWVEDKVQEDPSKGSNFIILIPEVI